MRTGGAICVHQRQYLVPRPSYALQVDLRLCDAPRMIEQNARRTSYRDLLRKLLHLF
jgi:hypothetical protein